MVTEVETLLWFTIVCYIVVTLYVLGSMTRVIPINNS